MTDYRDMSTSLKPQRHHVRLQVTNLGKASLRGARLYVQQKIGVEESFEIKLRNHKTEPVEIRAVEHLSRYDNWKIDEKDRSDDFKKLDSHTIEFRATLKPDEEKVITYRVHYSW
jgi:hypothetical protein